MPVKNDISSEIKTALAENNVITGANSVKKMLALGKLKTIVLASNCPKTVRNDIIQYSKISSIRIEYFESTRKELGIFCGKPFSVSILGIQ